MMYYPLQGQDRADLLMARTKLDNPLTHDDEEHQGRSSSLSFIDFAYFDGKMFAVVEAVTLKVLHLVDIPLEKMNFYTKMFGSTSFDDREQVDHLVLVALSTKLILVRAHVKSSVSESFNVFELDQTGQ